MHMHTYTNTHKINLFCQFQLIKKVLLEKPGGVAILKEYENTGGICDSSRRQMVNMLAAHMTETEGYDILKYVIFLLFHRS